VIFWLPGFIAEISAAGFYKPTPYWDVLFVYQNGFVWTEPCFLIYVHPEDGFAKCKGNKAQVIAVFLQTQIKARSVSIGWFFEYRCFLQIFLCNPIHFKKGSWLSAQRQIGGGPSRPELFMSSTLVRYNHGTGPQVVCWFRSKEAALNREVQEYGGWIGWCRGDDILIILSQWSLTLMGHQVHPWLTSKAFISQGFISEARAWTWGWGRPQGEQTRLARTRCC
jgi:hypothetical protein